MLAKEIIKFTMFSMYPLKWNPTCELVWSFFLFLMFSSKIPISKGLTWEKFLIVWLDEFLENPTILVPVLVQQSWWWWLMIGGGNIQTLSGLNSPLYKCWVWSFPTMMKAESLGLPTQRMCFLLCCEQEQIVSSLSRVASEKILFSDRIFEAKAEFSPVK